MPKLIKTYLSDHDLKCEVFSCGAVLFSQNEQLRFAGNYYQGNKAIDRFELRGRMNSAAIDGADALNEISNCVWLEDKK